MFSILLLLVQLSIEIEKPNYKTQNSNQKTKDTVSLINQNFNNDIGSQIRPDGPSNEISGCIFKNTTSTSAGMNNFIRADGPLLFYNNVFESDELLSNQPGILWYNTNSNLAIVNCSFIKHNTQSSTDAHILTIDSDNSPNVIFESCKFIDCSKSATKTLVKLSCSSCKINFTKCLITFNEPSVSCKILTDVNPNIIFDRCNIVNPGQNAIQTTSNTVQGQFKFTNNVVKTVNSNLIDMAKNQGTIEMNNNIFEDVSVSGQYFIRIIHSQQQISLNYNTFSHFTAKGSSGTNEIKSGGISTYFQNDDSSFSITYDHCTFNDIKNEHQTVTSSNGGAIQFGFGTSLSSVTVSKSIFKENKAYLHGGALAIQTEGTVSIINCTFENNVADNKASSLLLDAKADGRGGAIYLNPTFTQGNSDKTMNQATIKDCKFSKNIANGGYAIYIDGKEDASTTFSIANNRFLNNHDGKGGQCTHAAIDSEVTVLDAGQIEKDNDFSTIDNGSGSKLIVFVDHSGNLLPDPTSTPIPTPFKTPDPVEGTVTDFIDKVFEGTNYTKQIRPGSTNQEDIQNVKQVSGCYFKNIQKASDGMNNFIQFLGESSFFNNVIENDEVQQDEPGVIWLNCDIKLTILNCKFIRATSRYSSGDANILTVDGDNSPNVIFESCEFIDCAYRSDESLVKFKYDNQEPTVNFTDCIITFSQTGCQLVQSKNPQVVFNRCQITGCVSNAINLGSIPTGNTKKGTFQFTNNIVKKQTNNLINIVNLISNPDISHNTFEDVTLDNEYLIYIANNLFKLQLPFNTFSRITISSNSEKFSGGFACFMPTSAKTSATNTLTLTYDNCNFYDIKNMQSKKPYYQGGAVQCGFSPELTDLELIVTNCVFKGNQAFKHGGAIAIQIQGKVTIRNCTFEENRANCNQNKAKLLLYEDNTDKKEEGRGGAIYINPTFVVDNDDKFLQKLTIDNCTFKRNIAFDGFAIYIEGENSGSTQYIITNNIFINNYNGQNIESNGAVIASEVTRITEVQIETNNVFSNEDNGIGSYPFYHVDHSGIRLPDKTPTPLPTNHEVPIEEDWKQKDYDTGTRCYQEKDHLVESERDIVIKVEATSFSDMKELNGSAIHLVNCGLSCSNDCSFDRCGQEGSVGGAVYIYNAKELVNTINMDKLKFNNCKADYGGAIFIYSKFTLSSITIQNCQFTENTVKDKGPSEDLTGGSAMFLSIQYGKIVHCKFSRNSGPGGSVKLIDVKFDETESSSLLLSKNEKIIHVKDCIFNDNKASIFYMARNGGSLVDVTNCSFTAKLNKGDHHIDGMVIEKNAPKIIIKSCKFIDDDLSKVVAKNGQFANVDVKSLQLGSKINNQIDSWKSAVLVAVPAVAAILVLLVIVLIKTRSTIENNEDEDIVQNETI